MAMLRVMCKNSECIVEVEPRQWRYALNAAKFLESTVGVRAMTKAVEFVNGIKHGYEDDYVRTMLVDC